MSGELERLERANVLQKRSFREDRRGRYESSVPSVDDLLRKHLIPSGKGATETSGRWKQLSYVQQLQQEQAAREASNSVSATPSSDVKRRARSRKRALYRAITPRYMLPKGSKSTQSTPSVSRSSTHRSLSRGRGGASSIGKGGGFELPKPLRQSNDRLAQSKSEGQAQAQQHQQQKQSNLKGSKHLPNQQGHQQKGSEQFNNADASLHRQNTIVSFDLSEDIASRDSHSKTSSFLPSASTNGGGGGGGGRPLGHENSLPRGLSRRRIDRTTAAAVDESSPRGKFLQSLRHTFRLQDHRSLHRDHDHDDHDDHDDGADEKTSFDSQISVVRTLGRAKERGQGRQSRTTSAVRQLSKTKESRLPPATARPVGARKPSTIAASPIRAATGRNQGEDASPSQDDYFTHCERHDLIPEFGDVKPMLGATCSRALYYSHRQVGDKLSFTTWAGVAVLDLCDNNLSDTGCARVVEALDPLYIRKLDLSCNRGGLKLCSALADRLHPACRLLELNLRQTKLGSSGCEILERALIHDAFAPQLTRLCLAECKIPDSHGVELADALAQCRALVDLDVSWNHLCATAAALVALPLHSLNLSQNPLGQGKKLLVEKDWDAERRLLLRCGLYAANPSRYATARNADTGDIDLSSAPSQARFFVALEPDPTTGKTSKSGSSKAAAQQQQQESTNATGIQHFAVVRSHAVARALADALRGNLKMRHLDLSSCKLDEIDCAILCNTLQEGHAGLLGIHLEGNRRRNGNDRSNKRSGNPSHGGGGGGGQKHINASPSPSSNNNNNARAVAVDFRQHSGRPGGSAPAGSWFMEPMPLARTLLDWPLQQHCWICGGWVERTLPVELPRPAADCVELFIHFSFDGFRPRPVRRQKGQIIAFTEEVSVSTSDKDSAHPEHTTEDGSSKGGSGKSKSKQSETSKKKKKKNTRTRHMCYFHAILPPSIVLFYFTEKYKVSDNAQGKEDDREHGRRRLTSGSYRIAEGRWTTNTFESVYLPPRVVELMHASGSAVIPEATFRRARAVYDAKKALTRFSPSSSTATAADEDTSPSPTVQGSELADFNLLLVDQPRTYPLAPFLADAVPAGIGAAAATAKAGHTLRVPGWTLDASVFEPRRRFDTVRTSMTVPSMLRGLADSPPTSPQARSRLRKARPKAEDPFFDEVAEPAAFATAVLRSGVPRLVRELFEIGRTWQRDEKEHLDVWLAEQEQVTFVEEEDEDEGNGSVRPLGNLSRSVTARTQGQPGRHATEASIDNDDDDDDEHEEYNVPFAPEGSHKHLRRSSTRRLFEGRILQPAPAPVRSHQPGVSQRDLHAASHMSRGATRKTSSRNYSRPNGCTARGDYSDAHPEHHAVHGAAHELFDSIPWERVDLAKFLVNVDLQEEARQVTKTLFQRFGTLRQAFRFFASTGVSKWTNRTSGRMTYEGMKELVNAAGLFRSEPATLPGRSMVRMKNNFFKAPLLHLVVASAMHVKGRGQDSDMDDLDDDSSLDSRSTSATSFAQRHPLVVGPVQNRPLALQHHGSDQEESMDLPGFLHAIVNIAFWKFVASGSLRTLPRAVGLVVDSIAAALLENEFGFLRTLSSTDEFRQDTVYNALIDHRFKASYGMLVNVFINYSTSAISGQTFSRGGAASPRPVGQEKNDGTRHQRKSPVSGDGETDAHHAAKDATTKNEKHWKAARGERSTVQGHGLDSVHDPQNRFMEFESWMQLLIDVGIVAHPNALTDAQRSASDAAKASRRAAGRLAQKYAFSPMARSRSFAASMASKEDFRKQVAAEAAASAAAKSSKSERKSLSRARARRWSTTPNNSKSGRQALGLITPRVAAVIFDSSRMLMGDLPMCPCHRHTLSFVDFLEALVRIAYSLVHSGTGGASHPVAASGGHDAAPTQTSVSSAQYAGTAASQLRSKNSKAKNSNSSRGKKVEDGSVSAAVRSERELVLGQQHHQVRAWKFQSSTFFGNYEKNNGMLDNKLEYLIQRVLPKWSSSSSSSSSSSRQ